MAPIPKSDDNDKPNTGEEDVDVMDVPDQMIIVDSSDSEEGDEEFGNNGYQMLQQSTVDSDDEDNPDDVTSGMTVDPGGMTVDPGGVTVDTELERSTAADEACRLPSGLHTAGGNAPSYMKVPDLPRPSPGELLWNQQVNRDIHISEVQSEQIKLTMTSVKLPESNIPPWANDISEEEWKDKLKHLIGQDS
ncbi:uncharacterized protein LOC133183558 [Saccostrea echinata]|uniref:uncharacterized protein LOC133183558 n=1 Tax=Saccostrea echinata TaxID=191078 RepID=UPI002A814F91|nr:uncharacterized protein LOC133183558 [Saccostrea echinata]